MFALKTPGIRNTTQNYPFSDSKTSREKYWIMENFFSAGAVGQVTTTTSFLLISRVLVFICIIFL